MKKILLAALLTFHALPSVAQENKILVASASSSGTYTKMLKEISAWCSKDDAILKIEEVAVKGGSTDNLEALVNNKASVAFMHSDVITAMAMSDSKYKKLKTLVALYPEEIHVIARRSSGIKTGGTMGFGGSEIVFNTLADLKGHKVGAAGGGVLTARLLQGQGEGGFNVVDLGEGSAVMPALDAGQVQAVIFVGGAPLDKVAGLDGSKYKLLPIPEAMSGKVGNVYEKGTLNYPNLKSGSTRTLAAKAIVVTRQYTRPQMVAPQKKFRECFYAHLDDLKETPGTHPKWQSVDPSDRGSWDWYEIPGEAGPAVAAPAPAGVPPTGVPAGRKGRKQPQQ